MLYYCQYINYINDKNNIRSTDELQLEKRVIFCHICNCISQWHLSSFKSSHGPPSCTRSFRWLILCFALVLILLVLLFSSATTPYRVNKTTKHRRCVGICSTASCRKRRRESRNTGRIRKNPCLISVWRSRIISVRRFASPVTKTNSKALSLLFLKSIQCHIGFYLIQINLLLFSTACTNELQPINKFWDFWCKSWNP